MEAVLFTLEPDFQGCEILVTGFFEDERPLRGAGGYVDWRFNGLLSRYLIEKKLLGVWKETVLIPSQGRIGPSLILFVGLGKAKEYSYLRLRELFPFLFAVLQKLKVSKICFSLPEDEGHQVESGKAVEVLMESLADMIDERLSGEGETWIKGLRLFFADEEDRFLQLLLGLQTAQSILRERLDIQIQTAHGCRSPVQG